MANPNDPANPSTPVIGPLAELRSELTPQGAKILYEATGGEIIAEFLMHNGIPYVFGLSGSEEAGLWDALIDRQDRIKYVTCLHEQVAMAMADGFARASGRTPLVALHSIAGAAYAFGQMVTSFRDRVPVVVTAGRQSTDFRGHDGFLEAPNLHVFPENYTQWTWDLMDVETMAETLRRATLLAEAPPGGPVFVTVSKDLFERRAARAEIQPPEKSRVGRDIPPPEHHVNAIVDGLLAAKRPLIMIGNEALHDEVSDAVMHIAELLAVPVVTSWEVAMGYPTRHPSYAGTFMVHDPDLPASRDLFWSVGAHMFKRPGNDGVLISREAVIFHTGLDHTEVARNYPVDSAAYANIALTAKAVLAELKRRAHDTQVVRERRQWLAEYATARRARLDAVLAEQADDAPIALSRLFSELDAVMSRDASIVQEMVTSLDQAINYLTIDHHVPVAERRRAFGTTGGVLGWGIPAAIGVALGRQGRETWCIAGDGSFNFAVQGLWSAARYEAPVAYVILNNGQFQANRMTMSKYPGKMNAVRQYAGVSLRHPAINYVALAEGYGVAGERVSDPADLRAALQRAKASINAGKAYLLDVAIESRFGEYDAEWYDHFSIAQGWAPAAE